MNTLREALVEYLSMRRALGFKLKQAGDELIRFVSFVEEKEAKHITVALAMEWAQLLATRKPLECARRLSYVRGFARYRSGFDQLTEIPQFALLPYRSKRTQPYLYTRDEIQKLIEAALTLAPLGGFRGRTYYVLFGLLSVSGLRIGEALGLQMTDVDLKEGLLTVRGAKFGKSRLVPLHASTVTELTKYQRQRKEFLHGRAVSHFFVSAEAKQMGQSQVRRIFYLLLHQVGLRESSAHEGPRIHDFRHGFAIETMIRWYRSGEDVERRLPLLSAYLGHVHVSDTYWYLTACPELMGLSLKLLEQRWEAKSC